MQGNGEYRKHQNRLVNSMGETLYTPPTPQEVPRLMADWERFMNPSIPNEIDPLIRTVAGHYQFESIHPFDDGNGRTGRILMGLGLVHETVLILPNAFISGYILEHRNEYYEVLRNVTFKGNWSGYFDYMLAAFKMQAEETVYLILKITSLFYEQQEMLKTAFKSMYSLELLSALFQYPAITPTKLAQEIGVHWETASTYLATLAARGFLTMKKVGKYLIYGNNPLLMLLHDQKQPRRV